MTSQVLRLVLLVMYAIVGAVQSGDDEYCRATRCKEDGPIIRFPFHLLDCGQHHHPDFELSCSKSKETVIHLQYYANTSQQGLTLMFYLDAVVTRIDYKAQLVQSLSIYVYIHLLLSLTIKYFDVAGNARISCPKLVPWIYRHKFVSCFYAFRFSMNYEKLYVMCSECNCDDMQSFSLYTCPSTFSDERYSSDESTPLTTSKGDVSQVYFFSSEQLIIDLPLLKCTKLHTIFFPQGLYFLSDAQVSITWSIPDCGRCEAQGDFCRLADRNISINTSSTTTTYFPTPQPQPPLGSDNKKAAATRQAGIIPSVVLVTLLLAALLHHLIRSHKRKKDDQLKIKMFLEDYKAMKPTRYSYSDIKKVTKCFSQKLGQGGFGSVYKGQISEEILVAVKLLNSDTKSDGEDFINEVGTIGQIHHVNVVRLVGYCADACNRALVYEFQPNQSLEKYVYFAKIPGSNFLGWEKMQEIALGIAKGIEYLHQGCAQRILHFDIKPHNILLDKNFHPKISDFGLAKLCSKDQSIVSMTMARGTIGYIAPEVFSRNFGKVSPKSDVYSFGMLLLEMVGGRNAENNAQNGSETYFPEWIYHRLEQGEATIQVDDGDDYNIARKLTIVGLWCIGWHPVDRPSMRHVIQMLERQGCPAMPPNPFKSTHSATAFMEELETISESE